VDARGVPAGAAACRRDVLGVSRDVVALARRAAHGGRLFVRRDAAGAGVIVLDLGHVGPTGGLPPAAHGGLREDHLVVGYGAACARHLLAGGTRVAIDAAREYPARRRDAAQRGAEAYLALHTNAGGGDYALVLHGDGLEAADLARRVADALRAAWPGLRVLAEPAGPPRWSEATRALLRVTGVPAVLVEPGFIDTPGHAAMWTREGLERTGIAVAEGVLRWQRGG